jgi:hypothetical protein
LDLSIGVLLYNFLYGWDGGVIYIIPTPRSIIIIYIINAMFVFLNDKTTVTWEPCPYRRGICKGRSTGTLLHADFSIRAYASSFIPAAAFIYLRLLAAKKK